MKNTVQAARKGNEAAGVLGDKDPLATIMDEFVEEAEPKVAELEKFLKEVILFNLMQWLLYMPQGNGEFCNKRPCRMHAHDYRSFPG